MNYFDIAKICHQINKAYCESIGDFSQLDWSSAPDWQRDSAINGVQFIMDRGLEVNPGDIHRDWLNEKERAGWTWGKIKDPEKREHPCMIDFYDLPQEQQVKDHLFLATVKSLAGYINGK